MNCKQCNNPQMENELFCRNCGYQGPLNEQQERVAKAKTKLKNAVLSQSHSVIFLIFTICFTIMTVSQLASMVTGGIFGILGGVLPLVFMIIATVGLWTSYTAKDNSTLVKSLRNASIFDAYTRVMYTISIVFTSIIVVILFILCLTGGSLLGELTNDSSGDNIGLIVGLIILVIGGLYITVVALIRAIYANRRKYFLNLCKYAESGSYVAVKVPTVGSYIVGGCSVISGISSISAYLLLSSLLSGLMSGDVMGSLGEMEGLGELVGLLESFVGSATNGLLITGISNLILGAYYILSAVWMSSTHKEAISARSELERESDLCSEIERDTKTAVSNYENEKAHAMRLERLAAEEEAKKSQETLQEQQNLMMQMMQQMMANGMSVPDFNAAAPAEAPAESAPTEETTAEPAPAEEAAVEPVPAEETPSDGEKGEE